MSSTESVDWKAPLREAAETAARAGKDVRARIAAATAAAAVRIRQEQDALLAMTRTVMEGAARGVQGTMPDYARSTLRQVVDGLADGFATSAIAAKLALEEARGRGAQFAEEDLGQLRQHLGGLGSQFAEAVEETGRAVYAQTAEQIGELGEHATIAFVRAKPAFESALRAAAQSPLGLGREALQAGTAATRHAAGTLFSELAKQLDQAARKLTGEKPD